MKKSTKYKIKKYVNRAVIILDLLFFLLLLWIIISIVDVNMHNGLNGTGPQLPWNFFTTILNVGF